MPKTTRSGKAKQDELPGTLKRSPAKAQRTFTKAYDSAAEEYGDERRAHQVAFAAVKHGFEKVGDHWEAKRKKGPSDKQAEGGRDTHRQTAEGVDANASKSHLRDVAKRLQIGGRSKMSKGELVQAIMKENRKRSRKKR